MPRLISLAPRAAAATLLGVTGICLAVFLGISLLDRLYILLAGLGLALSGFGYICRAEERAKGEVISLPVGKRPPVVLVSRTIIREGDRLLLIRRSSRDRHHPGLWECPGGKLDIGQSLGDAQLREVCEETGLKAEIVSPLAYVDEYLIPDGPYAGLPYVCVFSVGRWSEGSLCLSDEHEQYAWMHLGEALNQELTPEVRRALVALEKVLR